MSSSTERQTAINPPGDRTPPAASAGPHATLEVVQERTDTQSRFYLVKLDPADDLIAGADKQLVVNLAGVPGVPEKIESAWLKSPDTLVVADDNDFGMVPRPYAGDEKVQDSGVGTQIVEIKLN